MFGGKFETTTREYADQGEFQNDARKMAKQGWRVVGQTQLTQRSGCLRTLLFGLFFPPKPHIVVSYERQK